MNEILHLINEMSPYLLLGFLIAGLMHAFVPGKYYSRYLSKNNFRSVYYAGANLLKNAAYQVNYGGKDGGSFTAGNTVTVYTVS